MSSLLRLVLLINLRSVLFYSLLILRTCVKLPVTFTHRLLVVSAIKSIELRGHPINLVMFKWDTVKETKPCSKQINENRVDLTLMYLKGSFMERSNFFVISSCWCIYITSWRVIINSGNLFQSSSKLRWYSRLEIKKNGGLKLWPWKM